MTGVLLAAGGLAVLAAAGGILWLRRRLVIVTVDGGSMEPTLRGADRVMVRRLPVHALRVGQIVVLERPYLDGGRWGWRPVTGGLHDRAWIIKRLTALPSGDAALADGHAVVRGDNADASTDSRVFGPVPVERILGVALRRYAEDGPISTGTRDPDTSSAASSRPNRGTR